MKKIKQYLMKILFKIIGEERIIFHLGDAYKHNSDIKEFYGQEGEDIILNRILNQYTNGFYIDVGAYHPSRYSRTKHFYDKGWKGINIDPNPEAIVLFKNVRKNDINLNCGIADEKASLTYYTFEEPAYNTFSGEQASGREKIGIFIKNKISIETTTLESVMDQYLTKGQKINFLTISAMGFDLKVIKSNNWDKYRPDIVVVHNDGGSLSKIEIESVQQSEIYLTMQKNNYHFFAKTMYSAFYIERSFYRERFKNN